MHARKRIISTILTIALVISMISMIPPLEVLAAAPSININIPTVGYIDTEFVITGEANYKQSRIDIVHIAIYEDSSKKNGVWCYREKGLHAKEVDFELDVGELFTWGDTIWSVNQDSDAKFDTGAYESVFVEVIVKAEDGNSKKVTQTIKIKELDEAEFEADCTFDPDSSYMMGEEFEFSGEISANLDFEKITVAIYDIDNKGDADRAIHYYSEWVYDNEFDLEDIPGFAVGDYLDDYRPNESGIDTSTYNGIVIVIYVASEWATDGVVTFTYEIEFETMEVDCTFDPDSSYMMGEEFEFSGEISANLDFEKITVAIYDIDDKGDADRAIHYYSEWVYDNEFDLEDIPSFAVGDYLDDYRSNESGIDTSTYNGIVIVIYVASEWAKDGVVTFTYEIEFETMEVDCTFDPDSSYMMGEEFEFSGEISANLDFEKITVAIYDIDDEGDADRAIHYYSVTVNDNQFDLVNIPGFAVGDYLDDYRSNEGGIDTSTYNGIVIVIYVASEWATGGVETFRFEIHFEREFEIDCTFAPNPSYTIGNQFAFGGKIICNHRITKVTIAIYDADNTGDPNRSVYHFSQEVKAFEFDLSAVPMFTIGGYLADCRQGFDGINTADYSGVLITVYVMGEGFSGGYQSFSYTIAFNARLAGDIDGDGTVTGMDRFLLSRCVAGMEGYTGLSLSVADINHDGHITEADVQFLSRHLAGWSGYEVLPEANSDTGTCSHAKYTDYWYDTVFLDNTYNVGDTHTYYNVFNRKCDNCGVSIGRVQGEQETVSHKYDENGWCSCGLISTSGYTAWNGYNSSGKTATVYESAYSSAWYGSIFDGEQVTVLGEIHGRYYIRYIVTKTQQYKYGYVSTDVISQESKYGRYTIDYTFETITLPISNRTVLLIPVDGSAYFTIKKDGVKITDLSALPGLKFEFSKGNVDTTKITAWTLVGGKNGGYGSLKVSFIGPDGEKIPIHSVSNYIVAESGSVYGSENKAVFSQTEKKYIETALDLAFSGGNIRRPRASDFTYWDNVLLNLDKLWENFSKALQGKNYTTEQFADVLASYLEAYLDGTTGDYEVGFADWIYSFFAVVWEGGTEIPWDELPRVAQESLKIIQAYKGKKFSYEAFVSILTETKNIVSDDVARKAIESLMPNTLQGVCTPKDIVKNIDNMISNKQYMKLISDVADVVEIGKNIYTAYVLVLGDYSEQLELLETIRGVLVDGGFKENSPEIKAVDLLIERYEQNFFEKWYEGCKKVQADIVTLGLKKVLTSTLPGAMIMLDVARFFAGKTGVDAEARYTMFRMISHGYITTMVFPYDMVVSGKMTQRIDKVGRVAKIYITMAIYENKLAISAYGEFSKEEREQYKWNIEFMEKVFKDYLK